jgi:hypothetical protein
MTYCCRLCGKQHLNKLETVRKGTATTREKTRPILEAFWHTKCFVQMMIKYAKGLETAPQAMPSGWAAILGLFELR